MNPADGPYADPQKADTALGRFGRPEEIASMVAYLAGGEAAYITGAEFSVDGGHAA
jgi:3-oxoacyl-[acyl-carrier protein] reductase